MTIYNVDIKSWGISLTLHALLMLIMIFWAAFPDIREYPKEIELVFLEPASPVATPKLDARPRVLPQPTNQRAASPRTQAVSSTQQSAARQSPAEQTTARDRGAQQSAPSTPVPPRELRGTTDDAVDFMDYGGGKRERSSAPSAGEYTRRESREQGLSTSERSADNVTGAGSGEQSAITSDPGTLSATPHSSADIQWDGGLSRNRISGVLPEFPPGATREVQVAVRFRVRPDGSMYGMTVIQKGDPRYERAALSAMRTWRFNALPPDAKQADQVGTAVFSFKLK